MAASTTYFLPPERAGADEIARSAAQLEAAPNVRTMLETMPGLAVILDMHRQIVAGNARFADAVGATASTGIHGTVPSPTAGESALGADMLGRRMGEALRCVNATVMPGGCGTAQACRHCGAAIAQSHALEARTSTQECRITARSGQATVNYDFRVSATPVTIDATPYIVFNAVDISDEKRRGVLEHVFFDEVMQQAGSIRSLTEMYMLVGERERRDLLEQLASQAEHLLDDIRSQRELVDAEHDTLRTTQQDVIVIELMRHVKEIWRYHPIARGKVIAISGTALDTMIVTDPVLLGRVLGNLLRNALEAARDGDLITFFYHADATGRHVFSVQNPQVMPEAVRRQIFQRSFSTKGPGRGVGTYAARMLTERHLGGTIDYVTSPDKGTTFNVTLP